MVSGFPSRKIEKFTVSPDVGKGVRDMAERNSSDSRFFVVPIWVETLTSHCQDDISLAQASLFGRAPRSNFGDVDPVFLQANVTAKLRIASSGEDKTSTRKAGIRSAFDIVEKVGNHRRGNHVRRLAAGVISHEKTK